METLLSLLKSIQHDSQQLLDCLNQEKKLLDSNQLDNLSSVSNKKQQLLMQLNQLDNRRSTFSNSANFNQFIARSKNAELISQWKVSRKIMSACKKQNNINGKIIARHQRLNQDILSIITGRNQTEDKIYNAKGTQTRRNSLLNEIKA